MTSPKKLTFKDVIDFIAQIKTEAEFYGSAEILAKEFPDKMEELRRGITIEHAVDELRDDNTLPLKSLAVAAFEDFKSWYAHLRLGANPPG